MPKPSHDFTTSHRMTFQRVLSLEKYTRRNTPILCIFPWMEITLLYMTDSHIPLDITVRNRIEDGERNFWKISYHYISRNNCHCRTQRRRLRAKSTWKSPELSKDTCPREKNNVNVVANFWYEDEAYPHQESVSIMCKNGVVLTFRRSCPPDGNLVLRIALSSRGTLSKTREDSGSKQATRT